MKWRTAAILGVSLAVGGLIAGVAIAQFSDTQTTTATINATSTSVDLYICEPSGTVTDPICPIDDSGADEITFEDLENLLPQTQSFWKIRLVNIGATPWDWIISAGATWTEVSDPGNDCNDVPDLGPINLGKILSGGGTFDPVEGVEYDNVNDNHGNIAHVEPQDYEDVALQVSLPLGFPAECENNVWDNTVTFEVQVHP